MEEFRKSSFKIVIRKVEKPFSYDADREFDWICRCLGFFEEIDKDKTASTLFKSILKSAEKNRCLTSTQLAEMVGMSRGSVINHLNNLLRAGLIERDGRYYLPRSKSVFRIIEELEEDLDRIFSSMKKTAKDLDKKFGLEIE